MNIKIYYLRKRYSKIVVQQLQDLLQIYYKRLIKYPKTMQSIIQEIVSKKSKSIPKLPKNITQRDIKLLEQAIQANMNQKNEYLQLKILLAEAYNKVGSDKCQKQISEIGVQGLKGSPFQTEARIRVCVLIADSFDSLKMDILNFHYFELMKNFQMSLPENKYKLQIIKAGIEGLKKNYYKAAVAFYKTSKDVAIESNEQIRIQIIEKAIILCLLSQKSKQLHQLVCQLYINQAAKKSQLYHLLSKLYSQTIIDAKQAEQLKKILPGKFAEKDSENISVLSKCVFMHNMISIRKCFQSISVENLSKFTGIKEDDLLKMIENSYTLNQLEIDQVSGYVHIKQDPLRDQILIKSMFDSMESLLTSCQANKL